MSALQDSLNKAHTQLINGNAPTAEKLYLAELTPTLAPAGRILVLDGLGRCLHIQGRLEEAEAVFREALQLLQTLFGSKSIHVAAGLQNLARLRSERGECEEAARLGQQALDILLEVLGQEHPRVAEAKLNLSSHQYAFGAYALATANLLEAMRIWEGTLGRRSMEVSTCLNNLGRICEQQDNAHQGVVYHQEAVAIRTELLGDHPETAFSLGNLGAALAEDHQWSQAAKTLQQALDCYERLGLFDSPEATTCRSNLTLCRRQQEGTTS
ncbi:MAG: tetratricopeptide repeat protein [Bilophila sp.]